MPQTSLCPDENAVSTVVSTLLLVGVAVVLAAVTATFVFGVGESVQEGPPEVSFTVEEQKEEFTGATSERDKFTVVYISHEGGDTLDTDRLTATVNGEPAWTTRHTGGDTYGSWERPLFRPNETFGAGERIKISHRDDDRLSESFETGDGYNINPSGVYAPEDGPILRPDGTSTGEASIELEAGDEIRIVWSSPTSDTKAVLLDHEVEMSK